MLCVGWVLLVLLVQVVMILQHASLRGATFMIELVVNDDILKGTKC